MSNFTLEFAISKVQETSLGLDMHGTHQVFAYTNDVNLIGDDIRIERNTDVLLNACKDIGFAVKHRENYVYGSRASLRHDGK